MKQAMSVTLLALLFWQLSGAFISGPKPSNGGNRAHDDADEAADAFIAKFHETLDVGKAYDEMASLTSRQLVRKGEFSMQRIDKNFFATLDGGIKEQIFKSEMNYYFIGTIYLLSFGDPSKSDSIENIEYPNEIVQFSKKSRYVQEFAGVENGAPRIENNEQLQRYLAEIGYVTTGLRQRLPAKYYLTEKYATNYAKWVSSGAEYFSAKPGGRPANSYLGLGQDVLLFQEVREVFNMYFINDGGKMKFLSFRLTN